MRDPSRPKGSRLANLYQELGTVVQTRRRRSHSRTRRIPTQDFGPRRVLQFSPISFVVDTPPPTISKPPPAASCGWTKVLRICHQKTITSRWPAMRTAS